MPIIRALNRLMIRASQSPALFILSLILGYGALFLALLPLMKAFRAATGGLMPLDWQMMPAPEAVFTQVAQYTDAARDIYRVHAFVDFLAPPAIALSCGAVAAWSLRHGAPRVYAWADRWHLFALFFCSVPFDYTENITCLITIFSYPTRYPDVTVLIPYVNGVKMTLEPVLRPATEAILVLSFIIWSVTRLQRTKGPAA